MQLRSNVSAIYRFVCNRRYPAGLREGAMVAASGETMKLASEIGKTPNDKTIAWKLANGAAGEPFTIYFLIKIVR